MGFFFQVQVPPVDVLCAMKFSAILTRRIFLKARTGLSTLDDLRDAVTECLKKVDLNKRKQDFAHLLFNEANADRILQLKLHLMGFHG